MPTSTSGRERRLDTVLSITASRRAGGPDDVVRACLTRGFAAKFTLEEITAWLSGRPDTSPVVADTAKLHAIADTVRSRLKLSSTPEARLALGMETTRRLIVHLMEPTPPAYSAARSNNARAALACIAAGMVRDPDYKDTALVFGRQLALSLGRPVENSRSSMNLVKLCVGFGWLRPEGSYDHNGKRFKPTHVTRLYLGSLWPLAEEVAAHVGLTGGDGDRTRLGLVLSLIGQADHRVWAYGHAPGSPSRDRLSHNTWLVAFAEALGVDPTKTYGLSARTVRAHRHHLEEIGFGRDEEGWLTTGVGLVDILDDFAERSGATERFEAAKTKRAELAEKRAAETQQFGKEKKAAIALLGELTRTAGPLPAEADSRESKQAWWTAMRESVSRRELSDLEAVRLREAMTDGLVHVGHAREKAEAFAATVAPSLVDVLVAAAERPVPTPAAGPEELVSWGSEMKAACAARHLGRAEIDRARTDLQVRLRRAGFADEQAGRMAHGVVVAA